ncbi:alpha/beta-hydrolase [Trametes meyenii]|nr:alpha/beta-hydrolase [Trametes meyenii]
MAGATLAGPLGACCFQTVQHVGDPRGTVEKIAGVDTYVARPSGGGADKVVLFHADIFGPLYVNSKLIMDFWADNGFLVLGVDYFEGDSYDFHMDEKGFDIGTWIKKHQERTAVLLPPWYKAVKEQYGSAKFFTVGYCYGAPYVMDLVKGDWITAGAFAHPAFLSEDHFKDLKHPILLSCAEVDQTFPVASRRKAEDLLAEQKATYFVQVFGGVQHGFATRGDPKVPAERWAKEESARSIVNWFTHFSE